MREVSPIRSEKLCQHGMYSILRVISNLKKQIPICVVLINASFLFDTRVFPFRIPLSDTIIVNVPSNDLPNRRSSEMHDFPAVESTLSCILHITVYCLYSIL